MNVGRKLLVAIETRFLMSLCLYFSSSTFTTCVEDRQQWNIMQNCNNTSSVKYLQILNFSLSFFFLICFCIGARTFIKNKETGMWCRGTITELIPLKSKNERKPRGPVRYKVCDIALLEVFLIDFGSSVVLIFSGYVYRERFLSTVVVLGCSYSRGSLLRNKSSVSFTQTDNQISKWH